MRTMQSPWSATRKKRFIIPTIIGLKRVSRVNTKKWLFANIVPHEIWLYVRMCNANYISSIPLNSISGLDSWKDFWFRTSCAIAVKVWSCQQFFVRKHIIYPSILPVSISQLSSLLRSSSLLMSFSFLRCSLFLSLPLVSKSSLFLRLSSLFKSYSFFLSCLYFWVVLNFWGCLPLFIIFIFGFFFILSAA